ncbi:MAG TPA: MarR family winged helix-turn-helix transcriptional regulator, partial [Terracidiphilus sp.]|nr:MarR family winged helix-turn-helix transcriptional regulator [Terracidiphilus sp.]
MIHANRGETRGQVEAIRAFNRFYTARLGLLRRRHLDGRFSLTEARALFEIGSRPGVTAKALRETLEIDNGYLSRVLKQHVRDGLVRATASRADRREKPLMLTAAGRREVAHLDAESARMIEELLGPLDQERRVELAQLLEHAQTLLARRERPRVRIERLRRVE